MVTLEEIKNLLHTELQPIRDDLKTLQTTVTNLQTTVTNLQTTVTSIDNRVGILQAQQYNSSIGRESDLKRVPKSDGTLPTCDYPRSILEILVAGNETLPNGQPNTWNKQKSRVLLEEYDEDAYDTETDDEYSSKSRARRLKVARKLGVSQSQLNFAQLTL